MKIQILSDLHIEFSPFIIPDIDSDIVILAGDIHVGEQGIKWAINNIQDKIVLYVLGNHEFYGKAYPKLVNKLKNLATGTNVIVLENNSICIEDTIFLGCTLWTDFELFGNPRHAGYEATQKMMDYRKIRVSPKYSKLRSLDTTIINKKSVSWLKQNILTNTTKKMVIITHHAPSSKSIPIKYKTDILSSAYASNLDELVLESGAKLWIHGHIHSQLDYTIGLTRIVCNSRGYPDEWNNLFNPELVIEI